MKKTLLIIVGLVLLPGFTNAHNGTDPVEELEKKRRYLQQYQQEFPVKTTDKERLRNLKKQVSTLQSKVMLLRNSLAKEAMSVRETVSGQQIDYLSAMKTSLRELKTTLQQVEEMIEG